jgi:hypothetical protein
MTVSKRPVPELERPSDASVFCVKGTMWLGIRAYVDEQVAGGLERVNAQLTPPQQAFFSQMFLATAWFDLFPMIAVTRAISVARRQPHMEQARQLALWHGEHDLKHIYKAILKQSTPAAVCKRFPIIYSQLYNFGHIEIVREEENAVAACGHGMPEALAAWWMQATEGYLQPILQAAGGRNVKLTWKPTKPDGERAGVPLVRVPSVTSWT